MPAKTVYSIGYAAYFITFALKLPIMRKRMVWINLLAVLGALSLISCKKESTLRQSDVVLQFSDDTLYFDTVLSTLSSVTGYRNNFV